MAAEEQIPDREHRGVVGVAFVRVDRVVDAMEFLRHEDAREGRDPERDVGVSQATNQNDGKLPGHESWWHPDGQERGPDEQAAPQEVGRMMPRAFERIQAARRVVNRVQRSEPRQSVGESMVAYSRRSPRKTAARTCTAASDRDPARRRDPRESTSRAVTGVLARGRAARGGIRPWRDPWPGPPSPDRTIQRR